MGAYDRWEMKLSKGVAPMVKEWADMVLFANYKTMVVNVDGQGAQKGKNKAQGGKRVMYTTHHSCWDAKNRYGLPDEVPFTYESIREIMEPGNRSSERKTEPVRSQMSPVQPTVSSEQTVPVSNKGDEKPAKEAKSMAPVESSQKPVKEEKQPTLDPRIPKKLRDLMISNDVCEWDIQNVCEAKGYVPLDTPLYLYEDVNPGFIDGVLVAAWDQVYAAIKGMKEKDALVFN